MRKFLAKKNHEHFWQNAITLEKYVFGTFKISSKPGKPKDELKKLQ